MRSTHTKIVLISPLSKESVITQFKIQLSFPEYCSANWDSFEECLLDFLDEHGEGIEIFHVSRSLLSAKDKDRYFDILNDAMKCVQSNYCDRRHRGKIAAAPLQPGQCRLHLRPQRQPPRHPPPRPRPRPPAGGQEIAETCDVENRLGAASGGRPGRPGPAGPPTAGGPDFHEGYSIRSRHWRITVTVH